MATLEVRFHDDSFEVISQVFCCTIHDAWEDTVHSHFHNSQHFRVTDQAKSEEFFSRHSRHSQNYGDIVTLKNPVNRDFLKHYTKKNSSRDDVTFFHDAFVKGIVKICQFYISSPYLQGFSEVTR